jgi:hypothetical protein
VSDDRDVDASRLAAAAQDNPTGWFERFYAEVAAGAVIKRAMVVGAGFGRDIRPGLRILSIAIGLVPTLSLSWPGLTAPVLEVSEYVAVVQSGSASRCQVTPVGSLAPRRADSSTSGMSCGVGV